MTKDTLAIALALSTAGISMFGAASTQAAALTGSGAHLAIPNPNLGIPAHERTVISNIVGSTSFDSTWSSPALSPWIGTFSATGPLPGGPGATGLTRFDFTTIGGSGGLPGGTFFLFSDLDEGSGPESFTLTAFDSNNVQISMGWLSDVVGVDGFGSGPGGIPGTLDMPSWDFTNGVYTFAGNSGSFNPNQTIFLSSLAPISFLEVVRTSSAAGFALAAPIPTPGTGLVGLFALPLLARRRR